LRLATGVMCLGLALNAFSGTAIGTFLFMEWEWSHSASVQAEYILGYMILVVGGSAFLYPVRPLLVLAAAYTFLVAYMGYRMGGYHFSEYTLFAYFVRIVTPLAFMVALVIGKNNWIQARNTDWSKVLLRVMAISLAITFFTHGVEALGGHPYFVDMIIGSGINLFGVYIPESAAVQALFVIGCVDILTSLWILIRPNIYVALWMGTWGLVTAFARITETGWMSYPEVLVRAPHYLVPLAIVALLLIERKKVGQQGNLAAGIGI
jgi:hypothetical protein